MGDFSTEFGDTDAAGSNTTRLWRMWEASGIDELHFAPLVYKARTLTHQQPFVGRETGEKDGWGLEKTNLMAYYFRVLEDLIAEYNGAPHVDHPPHPITEERVDEVRRYSRDG